MKYYPIYLDLKGRRVLVVGAGEISLQKLPSLIAGGANVHLVAPQALPEIQKLAKDGKIKWSARSYKTGDVEGTALVIAATGNSALQKRIAVDSRAKGAWVNIVDVPSLCDFIAPAIVTRGTIQIAISTGGAAPALAKHLRKKLEGLLGQEHADFAAIAKKLRPDILKLSAEKRRAFWQRAVSDEFFDQIKRRGITKARMQLKKWIFQHRHPGRM